MGFTTRSSEGESWWRLHVNGNQRRGMLGDVKVMGVPIRAYVLVFLFVTTTLGLDGNIMKLNGIEK